MKLSLGYSLGLFGLPGFATWATRPDLTQSKPGSTRKPEAQLRGLLCLDQKIALPCLSSLIILEMLAPHTVFLYLEGKGAPIFSLWKVGKGKREKLKADIGQGFTAEENK